MTIKELKSRMGQKVYIRTDGYNKLDGEYILTGIMQRCEIENEKMESGIFIKVSELPPQRTGYWIDINNTKLMFLQNAEEAETEKEKEKESIHSNNISEQRHIKDIQKNTLQQLKAMQGSDVK